MIAHRIYSKLHSQCHSILALALVFVFLQIPSAHASANSLKRGSLCNFALTDALSSQLKITQASPELTQWIRSHFEESAAHLIPQFSEAAQNEGIPFSALVRLQNLSPIAGREQQVMRALNMLIQTRAPGEWGRILNSPKLLEIFIQTATLLPYQPVALDLRSRFLNTQEALTTQQWIRFTYGSFPTLRLPGDVHTFEVPFQGHTTEITVTGQDHIDALLAGRVHNQKNIADLAPGTYTYLFFANGTHTFGEVRDGWEFGVKHLQLGAAASVLPGGTVRVHADGLIEFNAKSGSTSRIFDLQYGHSREEMRLRAEAVFRLQLVGRPGVRLEFNPDTLLPRQEPSQAEIRWMCSLSSFSRHNPQICNR